MFQLLFLNNDTKITNGAIELLVDAIKIDENISSVQPKNKNYYNNSVSKGYYDLVYKRKKGIQSAWHHIKFIYIKNKIHKSRLHLDIGCGPGTFLGILKKKAIGVDIDSNQINYAKKIYLSRKLTFLTYKNRLPLKSQSVDSISLIELMDI